MFTYEEVFGIKGKDGYVRNYDGLEFSKKILLIPELIKNIIKKSEDINTDFDIDENGFVNGYAISKDKHSFMTKRGKIKTFPEEVTILTNFYEGKACVSLEDIDGKLSHAIFDEASNSYKILPSNVENVEDIFSEGLLLCSVRAENGHLYYNYANDKGEIVSPENYVWASKFVDGKAIVSTGNGYFKFINKQFKTLMSLKGTNHKLCEKLVDSYDNDKSNYEINDIVMRTWSRDRYFYDCENKVPLFLYIIIDTICEKFDFTLKSTNPKEQLAEVLALLATKGTYMFDIKTRSLEKVKVLRGVQIKDSNSSKSIISYDKSDYKLMRSRIKRKEN